MRRTRPVTRVAGIAAAILMSAVAGTAALLPASAAPAAAGPARAAASATRGLLYGVSTTGPRNAWAVGAGGADPFGSHSPVLIMRWNGTAWKRVPVPRFHRGSALAGVTALSARDAWAVGEYDADFGGDTTGRLLILHWDGRSWTQVPAPDPRGHGALNGVAAVSARDIWAVGMTEAGQPVIIHWTGAAWHQVRAPAGATGFMGVTASTAGVWATSSDNAGRFLIARWNGRSWRRMPVPAQAGTLEGVTATAAHGGWAVGTRGIPSPTGTQHSAILRWNGARWSAVPSPAGPDELIGVSSASARSAWAVGLSRPFSRHEKLVIVRWNGAAWNVARGPRLAGESLLVGVAARSARSAWAVGTFLRARTALTLVLHWNGTRWNVVPS
jgi:uncharacterized membrane protein